MRVEVRLSGSGGQGLITAGIILAEAAIRDDKNTVQTQSYGPEARGGASKAEVIVSDEEINYPKVVSPDILVALTEEALHKYIAGVKEGALVIVDSLLVKSTPKGNFRVISAPIINVAQDTLKAPMSANIVTLGLLNKLYPLVSEGALKEAVANAFKKAREINFKALELGALAGLSEKRDFS